MSKLLTSRELADMLRVSLAAIDCSRSTGKLWGRKAPDYLKMGRTVRYELEAVEAWIDQFKQEQDQ